MTVIKDVEIRWVKCDQDHPDLGFSGDEPAWTVDVINPPAETIKLWKDKKLGGLKEANDDGDIVLRIKRKAKPFSNGDPKVAPAVVDGNLKPIDPNLVGNGSRANVQFSVYDWDFKTRSGKSADLAGIQVTKMVERENIGNGMEFQPIDSEFSRVDTATDDAQVF